MKMINRLIEPTTGRILLGGDDVTRVDPVKLRRRIGYVIQSVGLFPHQTIAHQRRHRARGCSAGTRRASATASTSCSTLVGPRPGRARRPLPAPALRRAAPAGRRRPGAGRRPAGAADGRAVLRRRPGRPRAAAVGVPAAAGDGAQDDRLRHPRHRGGRADRRPDRGDERGRARGAVRHPRRAAGPAGQRRSSPTSSAPTAGSSGWR